jgi:hypothetical protein
MSFLDGFDRTLIQVVDDCHVALPLGECLFIDTDSRQQRGLFASLAAGNSSFDDMPGCIPLKSQDRHSSFDRLSHLKDLNSEPFEKHRESAMWLCPRHGSRLDAVLRAIHSRHSSLEYRLELAGVQMPPLTLFTVIVAGQLFLAVRTSKFSASRVLHLHVDLLRLHVEFDLGDGPRCC